MLAWGTGDVYKRQVLLWLTVLFANFAEAIAEGRGKAQADALRATKRDITAYKIPSPEERDRVEEVPSASLRKGDIVLVKAGEQIPADGDVIDGAASVDESAITGESAPVIRESGGDRCAVTGGTTVTFSYTHLANAQRDQRVEVATANSKAITGENTAKIEVAQSDAARREKEAEAMRLATAAEKVQSAKALEEAYAAEKEAEIVRFAREKATLEADVIVKTEIKKRQIELEAEAEAERLRRQAAGEADAIYAKMEAEARGMQEILKKQASGFADIVNAAGGSAKDALMLMLADKMENLMKVQVEAIRDLKIDKVTAVSYTHLDVYKRQAPHVGFATKEALEKRAVIVLENVRAWLGGTPRNVVK